MVNALEKWGKGRCLLGIGRKFMKPNPTMRQVVQQLMMRHGVDLLTLDTFLQLDLAGHDSLGIDHMGVS